MDDGRFSTLFIGHFRDTQHVMLYRRDNRLGQLPIIEQCRAEVRISKSKFVLLDDNHWQLFIDRLLAHLCIAIGLPVGQQ